MKNKIKIIGGEWRGRVLSFDPTPELRPTSGRVRETLFNWLAPYIVGANCLDCFAGSGMLGFEALSRGVRRVTMLDSQKNVIQTLKNNAQMLSTKHVDFVLGVCPEQALKLPFPPYDIVFLDPPYRQNLVEKTINWLVSREYLSPGAHVYIEAERALMPLPTPYQWQTIQSKETKTLIYALYELS